MDTRHGQYIQESKSEVEEKKLQVTAFFSSIFPFADTFEIIPPNQTISNIEAADRDEVLRSLFSLMSPRCLDS